MLKYSGPSSGGSFASVASVPCDTGYTMVGCSGWGQSSDITGIWISYDDECCVSSSGSTVYSTAIWYVVTVSFLEMNHLEF